MPSTISVTSKKTGRTVEFERNFGETIEQAVELFGAEVVLSVFTAQCVIRAQGAARNVLDRMDEQGNPTASEDDAIAAGEAYKPGVVRRSGAKKADPVETVLNAIASGDMSDEQYNEFIKRLKETAAAKAAQS
jgi:hypothetical protein